MKTALSVYEQRIAPVFDTARDVLLFDADDAVPPSVNGVRLSETCISGKIRWLVGQGVQTLVCGAISMAFQRALEDSGLTVVSFVCGDVEEIVKAVSEGNVARYAFTMPGCCGRRRGCRGGGRARHGRCHEGNA